MRKMQERLRGRGRTGLSRNEGLSSFFSLSLLHYFCNRLGEEL